MTVFVLDNSVSMRWCFDDTHPYADSALQQVITGEAFVPIIWRYEVSAVLARSQKDGSIVPAKADAFLALMQSLNITLDNGSADSIFSDVHRTATTYGLTSYDLELSIRKNLPLPRSTKKLIRTCKAIGHPLL